MARSGYAKFARGGAFAAFAAAALLPSSAWAGNGANFVLYNQHTEEQGETEIKLFSDFSDGGKGEEGYSAQLLEIEHGVTDYWTTALYFEGVKINGEDYEFGGFRFENRVRLFDYGHFLNPVLYVEYEYLKPAHRYIRAVTGRTDEDEGEEEGEEKAEHEIESRLILGHDFSKRVNVAFDWINETNLESGKWEFGYATGLNLTLYEAEDGEAGHEGGGFHSKRWDVEELILGIEFYGGLGDSVLGLTLDPDKTKQYLGVNLRAELKNHIQLGIGGAFGLTGDSENAILRLVAGYEFE
jgi:hypothetical protein